MLKQVGGDGELTRRQVLSHLIDAKIVDDMIEDDIGDINIKIPEDFDKEMRNDLINYVRFVRKLELVTQQYIKGKGELSDAAMRDHRVLGETLYSEGRYSNVLYQVAHNEAAAFDISVLTIKNNITAKSIINSDFLGKKVEDAVKDLVEKKIWHEEHVIGELLAKDMNQDYLRASIESIVRNEASILASDNETISILFIKNSNGVEIANGISKEDAIKSALQKAQQSIEQNAMLGTIRENHNIRIIEED